MYMTKRSALLAVLAAFALGACSQMSEPADGLRQSREIILSGDIGAYTRATATAFEAGDVAGLFIGAPVDMANVKITSDGKGAFTPAQKLFWAATQAEDEASSFIGYYPWQENLTTAEALSFSIKPDQSVAGAYAASDFLYASASSAPKDKGVRLPFQHLLSRFAISVDCKVPGHGVTAVTVKGAKMVAEIKLSDGSVTASGEAVDAHPMPVNGGFVLILAPQEASPEIVLTVSNGEEVSFVPSNPMTFASGKQIRASLVLETESVSNFEAVEEDWIGEEIDIFPAAKPDGQPHSWEVGYDGYYFPMELLPEEAVYEYVFDSYVSESAIRLVMDGTISFGQAFEEYIYDISQTVYLINSSGRSYMHLIQVRLPNDTETAPMKIRLDPKTLTLTFSLISD